MELGSNLLKESKVSSCFGGVLVCRARSDFWFTKADGGDLPTKSSNVCNLPRMEYIRLQCKHAKRKWKGWRKVKKIKITSQVTSRILYLSSCHSCRLGPLSPHRLQKIFPEWANQLNPSQATQSISSTQGLRGFHDSSLGRLPPAQHLTMYYVDPIDAIPRIPIYTANGPLHCLYRAIMFPKY